MKRCRMNWLLTVLAFASAQADTPKSFDPRLEIRLFAKAPDIVHPVACEFDSKGRLLVVESHTHFPPKDYKGPKHDRIRVLEDTDGDGKADRFTTFYEGDELKATMDIARHPDGSIYVANRNAIYRFVDKDGDGKADDKTRLAFLQTDGNYPHNGLSGLCFDFRGDLYFGMGENLGASYKLIGSDDTTLKGGGEGGNIYHCSKDGKNLRRVATGFWNPFGICLDFKGRMFTVDNDPDSMPPCRMLHVVEGGDYGLQFGYGRSGRHPFQSWNGELPGTLPYVAGVGEAPCEVMTYAGKSLPKDYIGDLLVTSWADHRLERYVPEPKGASFTAKKRVVIQGGKDFRPAGLATAPDGSLFLTDWVKRDYTLHGHGAVWQVRAKAPSSNAAPQVSANKDAERTFDELIGDLASNDPFVRHAAVHRLANDATLRDKVAKIELKPAAQIGFFLAERAADTPESRKRIPAYLESPIDDIRFLTAKWIADDLIRETRPALEKAMKDPNVNSRLYMAYGTALGRLDGHALNEIKLADLFLQRAINEKVPAAQRVLSLRMVPTSWGGLTTENLVKWVSDASPELRLEAVRGLNDQTNPKRGQALLAIVKNSAADESLRREAMVGLADQADKQSELLLSLATDGGKATPFSADALRGLVNVPLKDDDKAKLESLGKSEPGLSPLVDRVLGRPIRTKDTLAADVDAWLKRLDGPGDVDAGRRVFFHPRLANCAKCHRVDGRGKDVGPDLSTIGQRERRMILESILHPSRDVAPHFQAWSIETADGKVRTGLLRHTNLDETDYIDEKGGTFRVLAQDIVEARALPTSIMPDGLAATLTDGEIRDLLAYLGSRK